MEAIGVALFGSRARKDHAENSDIDLLIWTEEGHPQAWRQGLMSLSLYPRRYLLEKARIGDLFVSHLVHEALPLWDPQGLLRELARAFQPRASYAKIIENAEDLGAFLIHHGEDMPAGLLNRRMAWVVRTVLIARAAERSIVAFEPTRLAAKLGAREILPLVAAKDSTVFDAARVGLLAAFLQTWGRGRSTAVAREDFRDLFERTGNAFALKTLNALAKDDGPYA